MRGIPHTFSSSSQLQSAVAAAALVSRPGKHAHVSQCSVQSSKVSNSGIGGGRNVSGGSASSTAWKKQNNSNTGRITLCVIPAQLWRLTSALFQNPVWSKSSPLIILVPFFFWCSNFLLFLHTNGKVNTVKKHEEGNLFGQGNPTLHFSPC